MRQVNFNELTKDIGVLRVGMTLVKNELAWQGTQFSVMESDLYQVDGDVRLYIDFLL